MHTEQLKAINWNNMKRNWQTLARNHKCKYLLTEKGKILSCLSPRSKADYISYVLTQHVSMKNVIIII